MEENENVDSAESGSGASHPVVTQPHPNVSTGAGPPRYAGPSPADLLLYLQRERNSLNHAVRKSRAVATEKQYNLGQLRMCMKLINVLIGVDPLPDEVANEITETEKEEVAAWLGSKWDEISKAE